VARKYIGISFLNLNVGMLAFHIEMFKPKVLLKINIILILYRNTFKYINIIFFLTEEQTCKLCFYRF